MVVEPKVSEYIPEGDMDINQVDVGISRDRHRLVKIGRPVSKIPVQRARNSKSAVRRLLEAISVMIK